MVVIDTPRTLLSLLELLKIKMGDKLDDDFVVASSLEDYIELLRKDIAKRTSEA